MDAFGGPWERLRIYIEVKHMLLAIDIGNSNIVIGGIQDDKIVFEARIATIASRPPTSTAWRSRISCPCLRCR